MIDFEEYGESTAFQAEICSTDGPRAVPPVTQGMAFQAGDAMGYCRDIQGNDAGVGNMGFQAEICSNDAGVGNMALQAGDAMGYCRDMQAKDAQRNVSLRCGAIEKQWMVDEVTEEDIKKLVKEVELRKIDLTEGYKNWHDTGVALARKFGDKGAAYFHALSKFNKDYNWEECQKKWQDFLKEASEAPAEHRDPKTGEVLGEVTVLGLISRARQAGIDIMAEKEEFLLPSIDNETIEQLPQFLKDCISHCKRIEERDLVLMSALACISACIYKVKGLYGDKYVYPNIYFYAVGGAASGKGDGVVCNNLVMPFHRRRLGESIDARDEYLKKKATLDKESDEFMMLKKPGQKLLLVPGNTSSSMMNVHLHENPDGVLLAESEGDTVANTFKSDFGNYSDLLRKAAHHEMLSMSRRGDDELRYVYHPRLSVFLAGTPGQVLKMFPSSENGLYSRFIFYCLRSSAEFKKVINVEKKGFDLDRKFSELGERLYQHQKMMNHDGRLMDKEEIAYEFTMNDEQADAFHQCFGKMKAGYMQLFGDDAISLVHRMGLTMFRIAMICTVLRLEDFNSLHFLRSDELKDEEGREVIKRIRTYELPCGNEDFNVAWGIVDALMKHGIHLFKMLPSESVEMKKKVTEKNDETMERLPAVFSKGDLKAIAETMGVTLRALRKRLQIRITAQKLVLEGEVYRKV